MFKSASIETLRVTERSVLTLSLLSCLYICVKLEVSKKTKTFLRVFYQFFSPLSSLIPSSAHALQLVLIQSYFFLSSCVCLVSFFQYGTILQVTGELKGSHCCCLIHSFQPVYQKTLAGVLDLRALQHAVAKEQSKQR